MFQPNGNQSKLGQTFFLDMMGISLLKSYRIDWVVQKVYNQDYLVLNLASVCV